MSKEKWEEFDNKMTEKDKRRKHKTSKTSHAEELQICENLTEQIELGGKGGGVAGKPGVRAADFLLAYVSLFTFIPRIGIAHVGFITMPHARIRYLAFYILFYAENFAMLLLWWFLHGQSEGGSLNVRLLALGLCALPAHVAFMLMYYGVCHPVAKSGVRDGLKEYRIHRCRRDKKAKELRDKGRWRRELWYVDRIWTDWGHDLWVKQDKE
jgi:hypothetical protein